MTHKISDLSSETLDGQQQDKFLNLGCGSHFHSSWINVDFTATGDGVISHNLRYPLPFEDNSFDVVYHSHVLEHFSRADGQGFLKECFRVLRPRGILRVVVPDLEQIAHLYLRSLENALAGSSEWVSHYEWIMLELYDQTVRTSPGGAMADYFRQDFIANENFVIERLGQEAKGLIQSLRGKNSPTHETLPPLTEREALLKELLGSIDYEALVIGRFRQSGEVHQWMYDRYALKTLLEYVGFRAVKICQHDESEISGFCDFGLDTLPSGSE